MKSKVKLSHYCIGISLFLLLFLLVAAICSFDDKVDFCILLAILLCVVATGLFYWPRSIEAAPTGLIIHRTLRDKVIPYSDISAAERCLPTAGGLRLCGSGGFLGYWGYFSDIVIGTYFGYYGDRMQCILLKLKGGKQYVISCEAPDDMIAAIYNNKK